MTPQAILNLLMVRLGNRTDTTLRANCLLEMNLAQETKLEGGAWLPWFALGDEEDMAVVAGTREVALPTGFLRLSDEIPLYILDDDGQYQKMTQRDKDELIEMFGATASETGELPIDYCIEGNNVVLFPMPSVNRTIKCKAFAKDVALADDTTENGWSRYAPDWLLAATGERVALFHLQDQETAAGFVAEQQIAMNRVQVADIARKEAGRTRQMG